MLKIRIAAFAAVFGVLFAGVSWFFRPMGEATIRYEWDDTVDVLAVGSSHVHCGVNPNVMWQEEGIAAYDFSSTGQPLWTSRNFIVEALKTQRPRLVIVDVYMAADLFENGYRANQQTIFSTFPASANKLDMLQAGAESEKRPAMVIDLLFFHTRWRNISQASVPSTQSYYERKNVFRYKGYLLRGNIRTSEEPAEFNDVVYPTTEELGELPEKNRMYLLEIIELAKEKELELLLIKTPTAGPFKLEQEQKAYNTVSVIAKENGIRFIDYSEKPHRDAMGFDFTADLRDRDHLNIYGAEKLSRYMAAHLKADYDLPDRRGDPRYASWDEAAAGYFRVETMEKAKLNTALPAYAEALASVSDLVFITAVKDEASTLIGPINGQLAPLGITADFTDKYRHSYIGMYDVSSGYRYEALSHKKLEKDIYKDALPLNLEVFSGGNAVGNRASIKINGKEHAKNQRGLNIVVYDKVLETVFDSFYVDTCGDEAFTIKR